jgi:hypothetical protein
VFRHAWDYEVDRWRSVTAPAHDESERLDERWLERCPHKMSGEAELVDQRQRNNGVASTACGQRESGLVSLHRYSDSRLGCPPRELILRLVKVSPSGLRNTKREQDRPRRPQPMLRTPAPIVSTVTDEACNQSVYRGGYLEHPLHHTPPPNS